MIRYTPEPGSPLADMWPDGVTGDLATVHHKQAHIRVKVGEGRDLRHLSLLVPWKRCEVIK